MSYCLHFVLQFKQPCLFVVFATELTYQFDSLLRSFFSAESYKGIASVQATERIHHQA